MQGAGTSKVALNALALSRNLRDILVTGQRIETPAMPPIFVRNIPDACNVDTSWAKRYT